LEKVRFGSWFFCGGIVVICVVKRGALDDSFSESENTPRITCFDEFVSDFCRSSDSLSSYKVAIGTS